MALIHLNLNLFKFKSKITNYFTSLPVTDQLFSPFKPVKPFFVTLKVFNLTNEFLLF